MTEKVGHSIVHDGMVMKTVGDVYYCNNCSKTFIIKLNEQQQEPGLKRAATEEGVESDTDAFARRCVFAWRAIRREWAQLKKEVDAFERRGGIHRGI